MILFLYINSRVLGYT